MNKEIPVKYNNEIVGYTIDEGKTIQFNDSVASEKVKVLLKQNQRLSVSSRVVGIMKDSGMVEETEKISYDILNYNNMNKTIQKIEDVYPMTIVHMRHGKFAIVEAPCDSDCVNSLEGNEEWQYDPHHFMEEDWEHINYGVGHTINQAFEDFKSRYK